MSVKRCTQCAADFSCQANRLCWCTSLPVLDDCFPRESCGLCPECLKSRTLEQISRALAKFEAGETDNPAAPYLGQTQTRSLIEGIDYTIEGGVALVFTAWYHLKAGECCGRLPPLPLRPHQCAELKGRQYSAYRGRENPARQPPTRRH